LKPGTDYWQNLKFRDKTLQCPFRYSFSKHNHQATSHEILEFFETYMKAPEFPIPAGQYYVTNGEENISLLTVEEADAGGKHAWSLPYEAVRVVYAKRDKTKRQEHVSDRTGSLELARWRDNSSGQCLVTSDLERLRLLGIALDGAGVRPAKSDHMDARQCKVTTD